MSTSPAHTGTDPCHGVKRPGKQGREGHALSFGVLQAALSDALNGLHLLVVLTNLVRGFASGWSGSNG
jgi:hypothetical protein